MSAFCGNAVFPPGSPAVLKPGEVAEGTLAAGEARGYGLAVEPGRFVRLTVEQEGIDLVVKVTGPREVPVTEVNDPGGRTATEVVSLIAEPPGSYRIELLALGAGGASGGYAVRIGAAREAGPRDRQVIAAERSEAAAGRLYDLRTAESLTAALAGFRTALEGWRELGERRKEADVLHRLGVVQRLRGESREALLWLAEALVVRRELGDGRAEAATLNQIGAAHWSLSEGEEAKNAFSAAICLWQELGEPDQAAAALNNLGLVHQTLGEPRRALEDYRAAWEIFHRSADPGREALALNNIGGIHDALGEPLQARASYERALELARQVKNRRGEAQILSNLGLLDSRLGEPQRALERFTAALDILHDLGDRQGEALALNNLSSQYGEMGEPGKAPGLLLRALPLQRAVGDRRGEAATLRNLGRVWSLLGQPAKALEAFEQSLQIQREVKDRAGEAATLGSLGLHDSADRPAEALPSLERAFAILLELEDRAGQAITLHRLGLARARLGQDGAARDAFERALRLYREVRDPAGEVAGLQELARLDLANGDAAAARARLEPALALVESLRDRVTGDRLRATYFASLRGVYELWVEALMVQHRQSPGEGFAARAFEAAEQARARGLLDLLREAHLEIRQGVEPGLLQEEIRVRQSLEAKAQRQIALLSGHATPRQREEVEQEVEDLLLEQALVEARIRASSPRYAGLTRPVPVRLTDLQSQILDRETVLLEYMLGEARSFLWVVTASSITAHELPPRREIEQAARRLHGLLSVPAARDAAPRRELMARLSQMLLAPAAAELEGRRLAIVPAGALHYVPFAALPEPAVGGGAAGDPLVIRHELVFPPSASVLAELRRDAARHLRDLDSLAILADPVFQASDPRLAGTGLESVDVTRPEDLARAAEEAGVPSFDRLAWTRWEAESIASLAGGRRILLALGVDASRETATGPDLSTFRVVHFATHGFLNSRHPELSGLVLSLVDARGRPRNGFLRLADIYNLRLEAELVVLSGCRTALGEEIQGEGILGLTRGFLYAGSSQVMASLWAVRDRATGELMQRFYFAIFKEGLSPSAALRAAQLAMRQDPRRRDPYFWAPFVVQGDWSAPPPSSKHVRITR